MGSATVTKQKRKLKQVTIKKYGFFITVKVSVTNNVGGDNMQGMTNSQQKEEAENEASSKQNSPF